MLDLFARAAALADCLCTALEAQTYSTEAAKWVGECCVWPGAEVAFDSCCENGGQAWVAVQGGGVTAEFPDVTSAPFDCRSETLAVTYEIGVLRCVCAGVTCGCDRKEADAANVILDFQAMLQGVACCLNEGDIEWAMQSFQFIGPEGGCAGSSMLIAVREPMPCC